MESSWFGVVVVSFLFPINLIREMPKDYPTNFTLKEKDLSTAYQQLPFFIDFTQANLSQPAKQEEATRPSFASCLVFRAPGQTTLFENNQFYFGCTTSLFIHTLALVQSLSLKKINAVFGYFDKHVFLLNPY